VNIISYNLPIASILSAIYGVFYGKNHAESI